MTYKRSDYRREMKTWSLEKCIKMKDKYLDRLLDATLLDIPNEIHYNNIRIAYINNRIEKLENK